MSASAPIKKAALVTGSATGVGRETAILLAQRGMHVAVNYSRSSEEAHETAEQVRAHGVEAIVCQADVADDAQIRRMVRQCQESWGRLDVLVNNAATTHFVAHTDLEAMTAEKWDDILAVNVKGAFFAARAAMPLLKASGDGVIVNVASVAGVSGSGSSIAYAASKGALITLTKSLATAFAPEVRVNAVCPGPILTRWLAEHQGMIEAAVAMTPLARASTPEDIAQAIVFLTLDAGMVTGQALVIDGGRTI